MIEYLLKVSVIIVVAYLFYKAVLQQESFFATNRAYLVGCIALAFVMPFVSLPQLVSQQGYLTALLQQELRVEEAPAREVPAEASVTAASTTEVFTNPETTQADAVVASAEQKAEGDVLQKTAQAGSWTDSWLFWVLMLYLFGVFIFSLNLLFQVGSVLYKAFTSTDKIDDGECVIINTATPQAPCSFFRYIFIYPDDYDYDTYEQIIAHEKIHIRLGHSYDLLIAELAVIVLWFNPLIWMLKKEIEKNDEYQTDAVLLDEVEVSKDRYQLSLLQIATPHKPLSITTNYNQSLLKQRIMMMNSKRSTLHRYWKYTFMAPLFFATVLLLNEPATSQSRPSTETLNAEFALAPSVPAPASAPDAQAVPLPAGETPASVDEQSPQKGTKDKAAKDKSGKTEEKDILKVNEKEKVKEIEKDKIKEKVKSKVKSGMSYNFSGPQTDMSEGYWYSHQEGNDYCLQLKGSRSSSNWNIGRCFNKSQFQKKSADTFVMEREAGTLQLTGKLDEEVSQGKYTFTEDESFKRYLTSNNITSSDKNFMFHLFLSNVDKKYVAFLKNQNENLTGQRLLEFAIHGITEQAYKNYVDLYQKYSNRKPTMQEILEAKIHGIDQEYVKEVQAMGYKDLSMKKMLEAKIHGVNAAYVDGLKKAGFDNLSIDKVIAAKIHGITPAVLQDVQALGYSNLSLDKIIELRIHGVNSTYVKELQAAGFKNLTPNQVVEAKIHGLNAGTIKELNALGFKDLEWRDMITAKIHGINSAYVEDLRKAGFKDLSLDKTVEAKIHGINGDFIRQSRQKGYNFSSIDKYITLKIHGRAIESLKE